LRGDDAPEEAEHSDDDLKKKEKATQKKLRVKSANCQRLVVPPQSKLAMF
jgi:hypothetical protein